MKMIVAIIPHHRLDDVQEELEKVGVTRMTVMDVRGYGRQKGNREPGKTSSKPTKFVNKLMMMIAVNDAFEKPTIDTIARVCYTGEIGDGKIFVMPLKEVLRISTKELGSSAI